MHTDVGARSEARALFVRVCSGLALAVERGASINAFCATVSSKSNLDLLFRYRPTLSIEAALIYERVKPTGIFTAVTSIDFEAT